jgi:CRP/FNR family cyclic AMP-dependent transcriptional regulator
MDKKQILERVDIFKGLSGEELNSIAHLCENRDYAANDVIFAEKSKGKDIFIVTKGRVVIELGIKGKTDCATIHRVGEGDLLGELAIVSKGGRSATARCETDCEAIAISGDALLDLFSRDTRIGYVVAMNLASLLAVRLRKTNLQLIACFLWE